MGRSTDPYFLVDFEIPLEEHRQTGKFYKYKPPLLVLMMQFLYKIGSKSKPMPIDLFYAEYGDRPSGRHSVDGEPLLEFTMAEDGKDVIVASAYFQKREDGQAFLRFVTVEQKTA